jgi:hypothetical protein
VKYMLLIYDNAQTRETFLGDQGENLMAEVDAVMKELTESGELVGGEGLADPSNTKTIRLVDGAPAITDGPFAEAKEHLGGFYIVEAEDLDAALAWGSKTSACIMRPIEVRPFMHTDGA